MKKTYLAIIVALFFAASGCGGSGSGSSPIGGGEAPNSIAGRTFTISIDSGSGDFASFGSASVVFFSDGTYAIDGDGLGVADSSGIYTYSKISSDTGRATINDSRVGVATYEVTFSDMRSGLFVLTVNPDGWQSGTFVMTNDSDG